MSYLPRSSTPNAIIVLAPGGPVRFEHEPYASERSADQQARASFLSAQRRAQEFEERLLAPLAAELGRKPTSAEVLRYTSPVVKDANGRAVSSRWQQQKPDHSEARARQDRTMQREVEHLQRQEDERSLMRMSRAERLQRFMGDVQADRQAKAEADAAAAARLEEPFVRRGLAVLDRLSVRATTESEKVAIAAAQKAMIDHEVEPHAATELLRSAMDVQAEVYHQKRLELGEQLSRAELAAENLGEPFVYVEGDSTEQRARNLLTAMNEQGFPESKRSRLSDAILRNDAEDMESCLDDFTGTV